MIHNVWQIQKKDCYQKPIIHIYSLTFINLKTYEKLYEQWNNVEHTHWQKFISENDVEIYLHNNLNEQPTIKKDSPYVGYWFFKQRTDKKIDHSLNLSMKGNDKILSCHGNSILIVGKEAKINIRPREGIMRIPFCELYFNQSTNEKIKELLF